jgi:hypothetical protein
MLSSIDESLFNLQDALLGAVHPCLRAVQIDLDENRKKVSYYFYYDCDVADELFELASVAITEAWSPDYFVEQHILQLPVSEMIPIHGRFAFLRKESNLPNFNKTINEEDRNLADCIAQEAGASFPGYSIHCNIFPVGSDNPMGKRSAYARWEPEKE